MSKQTKFFYCEKCKAIMEEIQGSGADYSCCGENLKEMTANTTDGAHEKHLPVIEQTGNQVVVKVGSVPHPMTPEHSIEWIYLLTEKGSQIQKLSPSDEPIATFILAPNDSPIAAYEYCNLHGLWKTNI